MKRLLLPLLLVLLAACAPQQNPPSSTDVEEEAPPSMTREMPSEGWSLHIDARKHFSNDFDRDPIAHHYCKTVAGALTECQLYESDDSDAKLVGVEVIIGSEEYERLPSEEKKYWHYHREEITKVDPKLPDVSEEEAAEIVEGIVETYGKVYILWNPSENDLPIGQPHVTIVD